LVDQKVGSLAYGREQSRPGRASILGPWARGGKQARPAHTASRCIVLPAC